MGINKAMFTSNRKNWETPQSLFDKLDSVFHFDLDAAASDSNHKVATYYTAENDGLKHDWGGGKSSAILRMVAKRQVNGLRNAMRSH